MRLGTTAIVGGTVVNLEGKAPIENAVIVVEGDRIAAIGDAGSVNIPDGAERIDVKGAWLIPGLMNMHVHLGLALPGKLAAEFANESEAALALRMAANARESLQAGVTTIRLTGARAHADLALMRAINKGQARRSAHLQRRRGARDLSGSRVRNKAAGPSMTAPMHW